MKKHTKSKGEFYLDVSNYTQLVFTSDYKKSLDKLNLYNAQYIEKVILDKFSPTNTSKKVLVKPLKGEWKGHYRFRKGNYRVIFQTLNKELIIKFIKVDWRKDIYD